MRRPHSPRLAPAALPAPGGADCWWRPAPSLPARRPEEGAEPRPRGPSAQRHRDPLPLRKPAASGSAHGQARPLSEAGAPLSPWEERAWLRFSPELGIPDTGWGGGPRGTGRAVPQRFASPERQQLGLGGHVLPGNPGLQLPGARQPKPGNQIRGARLGRGGRAGRWARGASAPASGCAHIPPSTTALEPR